MSAAAEAGEIQSCKNAKARKLENNKSRMSYQAAFAKNGENLSLLQLEQTNHCMTGETPEKSNA